MTDDEILEHRHQAELAQDRAAETVMLGAFIAKVAAEDAAIARFGLGPHLVAYRARFPDAAKVQP